MYELQDPNGVAPSYRTAIPKAVSAWETAIAKAKPALDLNFCVKGDDDCSRERKSSRVFVYGLNEDNYLLKIDFEEGDSDNTESFVDPRYADDYDDCGSSVACVKTTDPQTYGDDSVKIYSALASHAPAHLENMTIVFEEPAYFYIPSGMGTSRTIRYQWTDSASVLINPYERSCFVRNAPSVRKCQYVYIPSFMMHEFIHTYGILDMTGISGITSDPYRYATPTGHDVLLLDGLYQDHSAHGLTPTPTRTSNP